MIVNCIAYYSNSRKGTDAGKTAVSIPGIMGNHEITADESVPGKNPGIYSVEHQNGNGGVHPT